MIHQKFDLKDYYPFLKEMGSVATLEIFIQDYPVEMGDPVPKAAMVICPGSGYFKCCSREGEPVAHKLMAMNFNAFVLTYSCDPVRHPVQLLEAAAVYDMIDKNKVEWNTDMSKVGIMGFSAGGHLAAHYSNRYDCEEIKAYFDKVYKPHSSILCYPVISADTNIWHEGSFCYLLGHKPDEAETKAFSCDRMVSTDTPPSFIWHTAEDQAVPVQNSLRYAEALANFKIPYTLHIYPYGYHGLSTIDEMTNTDIPDNFAYGNDWVSQFEKWAKLMF